MMFAGSIGGGRQRKTESNGGDAESPEHCGNLQLQSSSPYNHLVLVLGQALFRMNLQAPLVSDETRRQIRPVFPFQANFVSKLIQPLHIGWIKHLGGLN